MKSLYTPAFTAEWYHPLQAQGIGCANCRHFAPLPELPDGQGRCEHLSSTVRIGESDYTVASIVGERFGCFAFEPKGA